MSNQSEMRKEVAGIKAVLSAQNDEVTKLQAMVIIGCNSKQLAYIRRRYMMFGIDYFFWGKNIVYTKASIIDIEAKINLGIISLKI